MKSLIYVAIGLSHADCSVYENDVYCGPIKSDVHYKNSAKTKSVIPGGYQSDLYRGLTVYQTLVM